MEDLLATFWRCFFRETAINSIVMLAAPAGAPMPQAGHTICLCCCLQGVLATAATPPSTTALPTIWGPQGRTLGWAGFMQAPLH